MRCVVLFLAFAVTFGGKLGPAGSGLSFSQSDGVAATLNEPDVSELSAVDVASDEEFFSEEEEEESEEDDEEDCEEEAEDEEEEAEGECEPATQAQLDEIPPHLLHLIDPRFLGSSSSSSSGTAPSPAGLPLL